MADSDSILLTSLNYNLREEYYHHAEALAQEALRKFVNDITLEFYNALALLLQERYQEANRQLENISGQSDVSLGVIQALIHAHKGFKTTDKEAIQQLESQLRDAKANASDKSRYNGALYLFYTGNYVKAKELLDKPTPGLPEVHCLRGWIELNVSRDIKGAVKYFEESITCAGSKGWPDAYLGKAKYFELRNNYGGALEVLNQATTQYPSFLPIQLEKMKTQLMLREWEQCAETAQRCHIMDNSSIDAYKFLTLCYLCHEALPADAATQLTELIQHLDKDEPKNWKVYLNLARLISRVCNRNVVMMQHARTLCERTLTYAKNLAEVQTELGYQFRVLGSTKQAIKMFRQALETENGSIGALIGVIHCQVVDNELSEAETQLEFLKEVHKELNLFELKYLQVLIAKRKGKASKTELLSQFAAVAESHFASLQTIAFGPKYFIQLDANSLLEIVAELYEMAPTEAVTAGQTADPSLKLIVRILNVVTDALPAHSESLYLIAKAKYLSGDSSGAEISLQHCLAKDQTFADAHLLMAQVGALKQICLMKGNFRQASQSLEVGLSYNFEVRDHPIFHLIKSRIQKQSRDINGAIQTLETAMKLPSFKKQLSQIASTSTKKTTGSSHMELTTSDRASVYLELIDALQAQGKLEPAAKLMLEAQAEFQGTKEEQRLLLSNADLALNRGDADRALSLLKTVSIDQPHYLTARQKIAHIYLHHKKDKRQFAACYRELVEKNPSPQAYIMLGDAYIGIQECIFKPERAIEVYETAMKKNPKDHDLARKIGQAYIRSHNFTKAVNYFEAALKSGQHNFLRHDLAELLFKLKNYEKCERVLKQGLERPTSTDGSFDVQLLQDEVKFSVLLSKLYLQTGNSENAVAMLSQAKDQQIKVLRRGGVDLADSITEQKQLASDICCQLARFHANRRELEKSINLYKEALTFTENDTKVSLALAHLYLTAGDLDACNAQCSTILQFDKDNNEATLMVADTMYQKNQSDAAMFHFQQLLDRNPNQYEGLARIIELLWRAGELEQAEKFLCRAEQATGRATFDAGYNFCKGLYEWYTGDPNLALQFFNKARRDQQWGERALYNMIEICINPDNEIIGGEVFEQCDAADTTTTGMEKQDVQETGVRTAEKFLKELGTKPGINGYRFKIAENLVKIASKNRASIEQALASLLEMVGGENGLTVSVGAILGIARGHMIMKQTPKAKQQLKRVLKEAWNFEDADYLEQCWLLLADTYINQTKYDVASDILKNCLQHNASCLKAYEYMGFIKEKEQKWADASQSYEKAWKLSRQRNPTIGYKLGFNYLKSKRFFDTIDVCHRVLELYPNYPKIRKDILEKARANLRM